MNRIGTEYGRLTTDYFHNGALHTMYSQANINVNTPAQRSVRSSLRRIRRTSRLLGALFALFIACAYVVMSESSIVFAAGYEKSDISAVYEEGDPQNTTTSDPFANLSKKITGLTDNIKKIATPIAGLCIALVFMMNLGAPVLPEFAQQNKGYVMRALGIVAFVSIIPELIGFVSAMT
jgi:hypothetical protein